MTSQEDRTIRRLTGRGSPSEYELDLTGVDGDHARVAIERMLERQRFRGEPRSVVIRLDPAGPDSGETLFQPVGRQLLQAMKKGLIERCSPLSITEGAGFTIELPGQENPDKGEDSN